MKPPITPAEAWMSSNSTTLPPLGLGEFLRRCVMVIFMAGVSSLIGMALVWVVLQ